MMGGEAVNGRVEEANSLTHKKSRPGEDYENSIQDLLSYSCNCLVHRSGFANPDRAGKGWVELVGTVRGLSLRQSHRIPLNCY